MASASTRVGSRKKGLHDLWRGGGGRQVESHWQRQEGSREKGLHDLCRKAVCSAVSVQLFDWHQLEKRRRAQPPDPQVNSGQQRSRLQLLAKAPAAPNMEGRSMHELGKRMNHTGSMTGTLSATPAPPPAPPPW